MTNNLSPKDREFADRYFGGSDDCRGNAARCYRYLYPRCMVSTAETNGPRLLRKAQVQEYLASKARKLREATEINAQWVLEQSIRLYKRCMGDEAYPVEYTITDKDTGERSAKTCAIRSFNAAGARAALELIGRNSGIGAFTEVIEVSHTHYLEEQLAKRSKVIEGRAQVVNDSTALAAPIRSDQVPDPIPAPGVLGQKETRPEVKRNAV